MSTMSSELVSQFKLDEATRSEIGRLFKLDQFTSTANVELWVVLTTLLLVVKFAIDSSGPWFFNKFMVVALQFLEGLNSSMVTYTLALMQLSSIKNDFFQVWGVLMVTLRYSVMVGRPYGRSKKLTLSDMMSSLWTANLLRSKSSVLLIAILLWLIWFINAARIVGYFISSERASRINQENMRLVTDYMRYEPELSDLEVDADPVSMKGYKYLVTGEDEQDKKVTAPLFRFKLNMEHEKLITTESVWSLDQDKLLGDAPEADADNRFKDVCLSFALYKLLRRRFHNLPSHEAPHDKTRRLILDGLLLQGGVNGHDYAERAFRVTEVELSFLKDSFHGNHAVMFVNGFPLRRLLLSVVLVAALLFVAYPIYKLPSRHRVTRNLVTVTHGVPVSYAIIFLIIIKELWEIYVYVFSQWTKVWMLYVYITEPNLQCSLMRGMVRVMFRLISRGQWDQQVGQYNIFIQHSLVKLIMSQLRPTTIKLQTVVKEAILESLKGLENPQSLGSYFSSAFGPDQGSIEKLSWANEFAADTHRILVWHIATCFCEIELCGEAAAAAIKPFQCLLQPRLFVHRSRAASDAMWAHYNVAVTLSNYCAYLLTRPPRLVPDNGFVSVKVFFAVRDEVFSATRRCKSLQDIQDRLMGKAAVTDGKSEATVKMGAELARQLLETYKDNRAGAWEVLAKFWTGFLLHLAASTKAEKHKAHLQGQGELITHLWALLSHAGFLGTIVEGEAVDDDVS